MPCWETSLTWRKSCARKDPRSDPPIMFREGKEENDIGKHRFSLCCILNLHVLSNIMLPSTCTFPLCAVNCVRYLKKKKKISPSSKNKTKPKTGIYGVEQVVQRRLTSLGGEGCRTLSENHLLGKRIWHRRVLWGKEKPPLCENATFTASMVLSLDVWHSSSSSSFRSCLLLSMMFSSQQSES